LTKNNTRTLDKDQHHGSKSAKLRIMEKTVKTAIKKAANAGETERVSVARHLRVLLEQLNGEYDGAGQKFVAPYLFQSVLAWGEKDEVGKAKGKPSDRERMSGD